ncbi:transcriptional regulator, TetR family [Variovorax sp. YR216]|nr:transcriptional regulator, TetR family [Variovorax sp. YR216]
MVERGLAGLKVLDVASRANANVALISYHFGNRDGLLDEVVRRTAVQIANARSERLAALLASSGGEPPSPRAVLRCWEDPWIENVERENSREVMQLLLHVMFAADVAPERKEHLLEDSVRVTALFLDVLAQCYPGVPREKMTWRMLCAIGASYLVLGQKSPVGWSVLSSKGKVAAQPRTKDAADELVAFILGGFSAPVDLGEGARGGPGSKRKLSS